MNEMGELLNSARHSKGEVIGRRGEKEITRDKKCRFSRFFAFD